MKHICIFLALLILVACAPATQPAPTQPLPTIAPTSPAPTSMPSQRPVATVAVASGLIPGLDLGFDCSSVERLPPDSAEAQKIVQEFVANFKEQWPTEYMAMEALWAVDRLGEYANVQGRVTSDEKDVMVVQQTQRGYQIVGRFIITAPVRSRYTIAEYFEGKLPEAPAELFYCMDVSRLVEGLPAQELDLNRDYDCAVLERIPVDSVEGQAIIQQLLEDYQHGNAGSEVEPDEVHSIVRQGTYLAAQARFRVDGRLEQPVLFLLKGNAGGYQIVGYFTGPTLTRAYFLREVYAENPDVPAELLACLDLDWFLARPTPTSTAAASVALGRLAFAREGDVLLKALPDGEIASLAQLLGIDNVSVFSRPRFSPSGNWLAFRTNEPDSTLEVIQVDGSGSFSLSDANSDVFFVWSPVEDRLAYAAGAGELKVTGEYGSEPRTLVSLPGKRQITGLAWSPDGQWMAYTAGERNDLEDTYLGVWIIPLEGEEPAELYASTELEKDAGVYRLLGWTSGGESLLFWEGNPYFSASLGADGLPLAYLSTAGGEPKRLAESVLPYDDFVQPDPSGSGRIAVIVGGARDVTVNKALYIFKDGEGSPVSPTGYVASSPAWSPDGDYLAYVAMPEVDDLADGEALRQTLMGRKLWLYDLQTGESRQLTHDPAYRDEYPLWSADGQTLFFLRMDNQDQVSLWALAIGNGKVQMMMDGQSTGGQGWFGYYGHIAWYEMMDWWRER